MKLKNKQILLVHEGLNNMPDAGSVFLKYRILNNIRAIQPFVENLQKLRRPSEKMAEYDAKLREIAKEHCELENGEIVLYADEKFINKSKDLGLENGVPKPLTEDDKVASEAKHKAIKEEYKEDLEAAEKQRQDFNALLEDEVEIEGVRKITLSELSTLGNLEMKVLVYLEAIIHDDTSQNN